MTQLAMQDGALLMCDMALSSECCEPGVPVCPVDCAACPTLVLAVITNVFLLRDDFSVWRFNHVEMLLHHQGTSCGWELESQSDVLVNNVDIMNVLPGGVCEFNQPFEPAYVLGQRISCEPNDPVDANWRFRLSTLPGAPLGRGCFFLPAVNECPTGHYLPCFAGEPGCDSGPGASCGRQDRCGPAEGFVDIIIP